MSSLFKKQKAKKKKDSSTEKVDQLRTDSVLFQAQKAPKANSNQTQKIRRVQLRGWS